MNLNEEISKWSDYCFWLPIILGLTLFAFFSPPTVVPETVEVQAPAPPVAALSEVLATKSLSETTAYYTRLAIQYPDEADILFLAGQLTAISEPSAAPGYLQQAAALQPALQASCNDLLNTLRLASFYEAREYQLMLVGQSLAANQNWLLAHEAFKLATELNPGYAEAWAFLGQSQRVLGKEAAAALETAVTLNPSSYAANSFFGQYALDNQENQAALEAFKRAEQIEPHNPQAKLNVAYALAQMGQIALAIDTFQAALQDNKEDAYLWTRYAEFLINNELQVELLGIPAARRAMLLNPDEVAPVALLGRAYTLIGNETLGTRLLLQALAAQEKNSQANYYYALHLLAFGADWSLVETHLSIAAANGPNVWSKLAENLLLRLKP